MPTLTELFTNIANAIRTKTGSTDKIKAVDFPTAIAGIQAGGGTTFDVIKINFVLDLTDPDIQIEICGTFANENGEIVSLYEEIESGKSYYLPRLDDSGTLYKIMAFHSDYDTAIQDAYGTNCGVNLLYNYGDNAGYHELDGHEFK